MSIEDLVAGRDLPEDVVNAVRENRVGAFVCDASRVHDANDHFLELVGRERSEVASGGLSWLRMTAPRWMAEDARAIGQLRATGRCDAYDKTFIRRDGTEVAVRLADVLLGVEPLRILAFAADARDLAGRAAVDAVDAATRRALQS